MKAMVQTAFGSPAVLKLQEVDKPAVADDDVLVRIYAASVNAGDWFQVSGRPIVIRLAMPAGRVIGWDMAGRV